MSTSSSSHQDATTHDTNKAMKQPRSNAVHPKRPWILLKATGDLDSLDQLNLDWSDWKLSPQTKQSPVFDECYAFFVVNDVHDATTTTKQAYDNLDRSSGTYDSHKSGGHSRCPSTFSSSSSSSSLSSSSNDSQSTCLARAPYTKTTPRLVRNVLGWDGHMWRVCRIVQRHRRGQEYTVAWEGASANGTNATSISKLERSLLKIPSARLSQQIAWRVGDEYYYYK